MNEGDRVLMNELGPRICILGPSNAGKSTLAHTIACANDLTCVHLDQLRHVPGTPWTLRNDEAFQALHDAAIAEDRWVMEGNYSRLLPQRLARATGLIVLDVSTGTSLLRYVRRCLGGGPRIGGIGATRDPVRWAMLMHIIGPTRAGRRRYAEVFAQSALPKRYISG